MVSRFFACIMLAALVFYTGTTSLPSPAYSQTASAAEGDVIAGIRIRGNQRVESSTIMSYLGIHEKMPFSDYDIDNALKSLFATGFFADVKISREGKDLVVEVLENPIVNRIAFEGNDRISDDDLLKELEMKPRSIYTRTRIQNDVKRLLDVYRRGGRYSATVVPKAIPLEQNRVDLVFEIHEGEVAHIQKIVFLGNHVFSSSALEKVIRSSEERWYQFLTDNDKYDPDRLQYDQELLRRFYVSEGYADFQVKSAIAELTPSKDAFYVTFTVEEGEKYNFGNVDIKSSLKGVETPEFDKIIKTKSGDTYNATLVEDSIDAMVKELGNRGFAFVDIDPDVHRNIENRTIDLTYNIKEGPRVYVERINIVGNVRTLDEVVRREFRIAEGDAYSTSKIKRSEQRLNNLGFFEKVNITNEPGSAPDKTIINVEVAEKSTGEISIGGGFSTTDGALADFGIRESNFLGRGQELKLKALLAVRRQQYDFSFTEPYFMGRELSAGFDLFHIQQDLQRESSYDREVNGFRLRTGYYLTEKLQHMPYYSFSDTTVTNVAPTASAFIKEQEGKATNSAIGHAFVYENRNNKFDPSDGYFFRFDQELSGLGGDTRYIRNEIKGDYYWPIADKWVVELLGAGGYIHGIGKSIRINDRFFVGGDDMRGFENAGIGPRDTATNDALGGNVYYTGSTELHFPLPFLSEDLGFSGSAFVDVGSLWDTDSVGPTVFDSSSVRVSSGVGVAWISPFGPLRVYLAQPVIKEKVDRSQLFRFSFGTRF